MILGFHNQCVRFWALSTSIFRPCGRLLPLFETAAGDLATSADRVAADFLCECCAVSWRSLGRPVDDDEMLLRLVILPRPDRTAAPSKIDALNVKGGGLSVLRERYVTADEITRSAEQLVASIAQRVPEDIVVRVEGIYKFPASLARSHGLAAKAELGDPRYFGIYETRQDRQPAHADVLLAGNRFADERGRRDAAFELGRSLQPFFQTTSAFGMPALSRISQPGQKPILGA